MKSDLCIDTNDSQRRALIPRMKKIGMTWECGVVVEEIFADGVLYRNAQGESRLMKADTILYATGSHADTDNIQAIDHCVPWFRVVGDARKARTVKDATYEGFCAAMDIL